MADVSDLGTDRQCGVIAGVGPVRSLRALEYIRTKVPGIHVPEAIVRRLRGVPADRVADEGMQICVEIIQRLTEISGVAGAHVMAFGYERGIPEILERLASAPARIRP
jgi:methylenetetrahydrofolate reductase (NADPH)